MTARDTAEYINNKANISHVDEMDVILLAIKGCFPAFNYLRYVGSTSDKWGRNLYKINGIKGLYEDIGILDVQKLANHLINDRSVFSQEHCEKSSFSIVKHFKTKELNDPRYELIFDTRIILGDIENNANNHYAANFYSINTPYSELNAEGIFNGIIKSPFIKPLKELHTPTPYLLEKELNRFFLFKGEEYPYFLETFTVNLFDSAFFTVDMPVQICYQIYQEQSDIFDEENIGDIFFFYREHIDELIEKTYLNNQTADSQSEEKDKRIAELEQQLEELKQKLAQATQSPTVGNSQNYNPTERNTHLQMIAILAEELAKSKNGKYLKKSTGLPNHLNLSELLERLAKEIEIEAVTAKSVDTYRKRLGEASQYYKGD